MDEKQDNEVIEGADWWKQKTFCLTVLQSNNGWSSMFEGNKLVKHLLF